MSADNFIVQVKVIPKAQEFQQDLQKIADKIVANVNVKISGQQGVKDLNKDLKGLDKNAKQATDSAKNLGNSLNQVDKESKSLGQSFGDIVTKVGKFYLATKPIQMMQQAFDEAIETVKEFDDVVTEFKKVSDLNGESLDDYTQKLGELGQTVARTRSEMVSSSTEFVKSGYSEEDAAQLARIAELYRNIADEAISSGDSANFIISQMKAFSNDTEAFALHTINAINNVSNNMAVSSSDISTALSKTSSAMGALGNTYEQTIALVTSGTEIMQGQASKVARGLRTIGNNIANAAQGADTLEISVQGVTKQIDLLDSTTGDMRSTFDIMQDIFTSGWNDMTNAEQQALAISLAGKNQFEVFTSVLSNFADAQKAVTLATESANSAEKENEAYLDSLGAKLNLLKSQLQELVLGKGGLQEFAKILLDVGIAILKFANSDIGQAIIKITLWTAGINGAFKALELLKGSQIINWISTFITAMTAAKDSTIGFVGALELANINPIVLAITALVGVVIAAKAAYDHFNVTLEEHVEKLKELKSDYEEAQTKADELEKQLENVRDRIEEINSKDNLELTDETQLRMLQEEEASLENQLLVQKELARIAKEKATDEAKQTLQKETTDAGAFGSTQVNVASGYTGDIVRELANKGTVVEALDSYTKQLNETQDEIDSLLTKRAELEQSNQKESEEYKQINSDIDALRTKKAELREITASYAETVSLATQGVNEEDEVIQSATASLTSYTETLQRLDGEDASGNADKTADSVQKVADSADNANDNLGETGDYLSDLAKSAGVSADELQNFADAMGLAVESAAEILPRFNEWNEAVDDIQSSYETLTQAVEEYNEQGGYTTDTLQQLLALDPAYLAALQEENGQLTINTQMLMTKVQAQAEEAKQIIYNTAIEKLNAVASGEAGNATETAGQQHNNAVAGIDAETGSLNENTKAKLANAVAEARGRGGGAAEGEINQILSEMKNQLKAVDNWVNTTAKDFSKGMGKAAKATNKATKAVKEQKSATETLKEKYKTVIDFIIKQYDKQIDKIKEAKDAAIKSVESQIKALEKEKDSKVKAIDAEITALQRERDAREKYWQDQLDKLEKENDERERNIALQEKQQALALAQQTNVMVLKDGQFQYTQDETAVAGAEQDLAQQEDQNEYERQKELIEELRDTELEWYDERIQSLEDYKDQVEEYYENQIEQLEEYKEYLEEYYEAQIEALKAEKEAVNETLEEGVANQQEYWDKMKEQLQSFVEEWNALVGEMTFPNISGSGISLSAVGGKITASMGGKSTGDNKVSAYASGKGSISDSEIAVVGENPKYRELVIGSKLNNDQGVVMNLKRGSGVVNAGTTNTLASIFNSLNGQKSVGQPVSNSNQSMSIQIGSINLPEVKDGQGFIDYLQNFSADITQQSFRRA